MAIFDRPTTPGIVPTEKSPTFNCGCTRGTGTNLVRAPYESEFNFQLQQIAQSYKNRCVRRASACSFGTPFQVEMEMAIDVDGTSLTDSQRRQAVEAFMRASNTVYSATVDNCQLEFRRLEQSSSHSFVVRSRHVEDSSVREPTGASDRDLQQSRFTRMRLRLKAGGPCNACSNKAFLGNRPDALKITSTPKSRELQQTFDDTDTAKVFMPKFIRGTGWVNEVPNMDWTDISAEVGAVRLLDTMRPTLSTDSRYNQPLCANAAQHGDTGAPHLGSPNRDCPVRGPSTSFLGRLLILFGKRLSQWTVISYHRKRFVRASGFRLFELRSAGLGCHHSR